ncbi:Agnestins biosynthesis cluster transcription factor AgnL11 [Pseudocercospora fuligena]|uniref:Agnestins biosynthesis cluster transcription factor AgnL11 n=1 Tax=Pseudocercospora fuligena TaxID=685502 RepID=A0A8H6VGP0_9PEZI|nr:Agnestins biosynthesis cluster transcription factor AgnL11 [Pseudocercospora fuligena]
MPKCVKAGESDACTTVWAGGYDPRVHRVYPACVSDLRRRRDHTRPSNRNVSQQPQRNDSPVAVAYHDHEGNKILATDPVVAKAVSATCPNGAAIIPDHLSLSDAPHKPCTEIEQIQRRLPLPYQILELVTYHLENLAWHHQVLHGPTFLKEVNTVLDASKGNIRLTELDLQWCALLFAVLATTLACTQDEVALRMGFPLGSKRPTSRSFHQAAMSCLRLGEFASKPHICSTQTIQILMGSSHLLGYSNQQFVMFGSAHRIAQNLGLSKLKEDTESCKGASKLRNPIQREVGRRVWWCMAMQDWLSLPSYDMFAIHPKHFSIPRPRHIEGTELKEVAEFFNYALNIAYTVIEYHVASMEETSATDTTSKYELALKYDSRLRDLTPWRPTITSESPPWLQWAASSARIIHDHKAIIIHRHFLGKSFRDPAYAYTRWASITASRNIIAETFDAFSIPDRPHVWTTHAHLTGAGVTLCLDLMYRSASEPEFATHRNLVEQALTLLNQVSKDSVLASRGHRLLSSMLKESINGGGPESEKNASAAIRHSSRLHEADDGVDSWPIQGSSATLDAEDEVVDHAEEPHLLLNGNLGDAGGWSGNAGLGDSSSAEMSWTELLTEFFPDQFDMEAFDFINTMSTGSDNVGQW